MSVESMVISVDCIDDVHVTGDVAAAEAKVSFGTGGSTSFTLLERRSVLLREDGRWKDCTPSTSAVGST